MIFVKFFSYAIQLIFQSFFPMDDVCQNMLFEFLGIFVRRVHYVSYLWARDVMSIAGLSDKFSLQLKFVLCPLRKLYCIFGDFLYKILIEGRNRGGNSGQSLKIELQSIQKSIKLHFFAIEMRLIRTTISFFAGEGMLLATSVKANSVCNSIVCTLEIGHENIIKF